MRQRDREPQPAHPSDPGYAGPGYADHGWADAGWADPGWAEPHGEHPDYREYHGDYQVDHHADYHDEDGSLLDAYTSVEHDDGGRLPRVSRASGGDLPPRRGRHGRRRRRGGNRRLIVGLCAVFVVLLVAVSIFFIRPLLDDLGGNNSDYSGSGTGAVLVTVRNNDTASDIGDTLQHDGVVASVGAFTDAASANSNSQDIQPGLYHLLKHMSARKALDLLLKPSARVNADTTVPEGATILDVEKRLTLPVCTAAASPTKACGPGITRAQLQRAFEHVGSLGLPTDYLVDGQPLKSVEGFAFPGKYFFPTGTSASDALTQMISKFADNARDLDFTASARALKITPYQELIIASLAQSEAKYASDYPKIARVILNRLVRGLPLQIDAATRYGAMLDGKDPSSVTYSNYNTPYNTYLHTGLPPTPIDNPGTDAMSGVAHPAGGDLLYYVNGDADGHLVFLRTAAEFEQARAKCAAKHWGCA